MRFDVVVVGGGTAGCVLAARLSENPDRSVCLLEAGPDYGPLSDGRWPTEMLDPRTLQFTHDWGVAGEDERSLGARIVGGSSSHNACMVVAGSPADYDEWGAAWAYDRFTPYLARARAELRTTSRNTDRPAPFHLAFLEAAQDVGYQLLENLDDPEQPVGVGPFPANVVDDTRWSTALAYLDPARERANLTIEGEVLVDRVLFEGMRAAGVVTGDGRRFEAETVILAAGAYFSPAILLRSGIGPEPELGRLGVPTLAALPVGDRLLDHCGTGVAWRLTASCVGNTAAHAREYGLYEPHVMLKAASSTCPAGTWDLHLLSWLSPLEGPDAYEASSAVFLVKPRSTGRLRLRSTDPAELPLVTRGFLSDPDDVAPLLEGIGLARELGSTRPLSDLLAEEIRPGPVEPEQFLRETVRSYFHPAGTCPVGTVVDEGGRVLGVENLRVADASIMPTIPRANTNLTTAAIAERIAETL
jgi:choline dehydrogenase